MSSQIVVSSTPLIRVRSARFEDVSGVLRLIDRAIERGCRRHYSARERRAVYATYASTAFLDVMAPHETFVVETDDGALAAFAQLDPSIGRLRALFVDAEAQGQGLGAALLAHVVERAVARGNRRIHGAMALNAVAFYEGAGFRPCAGRDQLLCAGVHVPVTPMERPL